LLKFIFIIYIYIKLLILFFTNYIDYDFDDFEFLKKYFKRHKDIDIYTTDICDKIKFSKFNDSGLSSTNIRKGDFNLNIIKIDKQKTTLFETINNFDFDFCKNNNSF